MRKALCLAAVLALALPGAAPARAEPAGAVAWTCSVAGPAAVAAAVAINAQTLSGVVSGVVAPFNPALLYGGVTAIMVSSACALGFYIAPGYVSPGPAVVPVPVPARPLSAGTRLALADDPEE